MNRNLLFHSRITTLCAALVLTLAAPVMADVSSSSSDKSATLTKSQSVMSTSQSDQFSQADLDRDGKLSRIEFQAQQQDMQSQSGTLASAGSSLQNKSVKDVTGVDVQNHQELDKDRAISALGGMSATQSGQVAQSFDVLDTNQDGRIDRTEFSAFETTEMSSSGSSNATPDGNVAPHRSDSMPGSSSVPDKSN